MPLASPATRSRAAHQPVSVPVTPWPARNTLRSAGVATLSRLEARLPLLQTATCCALATARSIVVARIVSISTAILTPRQHHHGSPLGAIRKPFPALTFSPPFLILFSSIRDNVNGRALPNQVAVSGNTIETCTAACNTAGYSLAGMEYSVECWCGNSVGAGGALATASDCNMPCSGNNLEFCGGPNRLTVYKNTNAPATASPSIPSTVGLWKSLGCYR
jgi:hypothetical protein